MKFSLTPAEQLRHFPSSSTPVPVVINFTLDPGEEIYPKSAARLNKPHFSCILCLTAYVRSHIISFENQTPTLDSEKMDAQDLQETIHTKLIKSGERERLKELLRERLAGYGWEDKMKALCRAFVRDKVTSSVRMDDLIKVITTRGRDSVPDNVQAELLQQIRSFIASNAV